MAERFFGRYEHSLDVKGRVTLPARFRTRFETRIVVTPHEHDKCLVLWTPDEFDVKLAQVEKDQDRDAEQRRQARLWAAAVTDVEMDRQGRVPISQYLRDYGGLDSAVLVTGAINRIELWNPAEWEARVVAGPPDPFSGRPDSTDPSAPVAPSQG